MPSPNRIGSRLVAVLLVAALAGCVSSKRDEPPVNPSTSSSNSTGAPLVIGTECTENCSDGTPPAKLTRIELLGCIGEITNFLADTAKAQAMVASGYEVSEFSAGITVGGLKVLVCDTALVGNLTVAESFSFAAVSVPIEAPGNVRDANGTNGYALEVVISDPTILTLFTDAGFPAFAGDVSLTIDGARLVGEVTREGVLLYEYQDAPYLPPEPPAYATTSRHHHADGQRQSWYHQIGQEERPNTGMTHLMRIHGGTIAALATVGTIEAGTDQFLSSDFTFEFGGCNPC